MRSDSVADPAYKKMEKEEVYLTAANGPAIPRANKETKELFNDVGQFS